VNVPLVSVLVTFYQQAPYVSETVSSILAQTHPRVEAVLTDDGSTDGTRQLLETLGEQHPHRLKVLTVPENTGISANVNRGLRACTGDYIALLSGDDVMLPGKLERQVAALQAHPDAALCHHDAEVFASPRDEVLGLFTELMNGRPGTRSGGAELLFDTSYLMLPSTFMMPRWALPERPFDERLRFANELLWHAEIAARGRIIGLDDVLVRYRRHATNTTSDRSYDATRLEEFLMVMAIVTARHPRLHGLAQRRSAGYLLEGARAALRAGERRRAFRLGLAALRHAGVVRGTLEAARLLNTQRRRGTVRSARAHRELTGGR
jgi:glycosyltransferase involved in cell wall biosynthesis